MDDLIKSALESLDGFDPEIYPFIPYLLQDVWEIGSSSQKIIDLIEKNRFIGDTGTS